MTKENNSLEKSHLKSIPPMPRDAFEIEVDTNGILHISAQDESINISNEKGLLSQGIDLFLLLSRAQSEELNTE